MLRVFDGDPVLIRGVDGDPVKRKPTDGEAILVQKVRIETEYYDGPIEITPSPEAQVLSTTGKTVTEDITVNPIPSNYGLITWDGTRITVS